MQSFPIICNIKIKNKKATTIQNIPERQVRIYGWLTVTHFGPVCTECFIYLLLFPLGNLLY